MMFSEISILHPPSFKDQRGFLTEVFYHKNFSYNFVLDKYSYSKNKNTIRGLHFQTPPFQQAKLVQVFRGDIMAVAVDIRHQSGTFGQHMTMRLNDENGIQLLIPEGFAFGFCTLTDDVVFFYKLSGDFSPEHDKGLRWNDPELNIPWPVDEQNAIVSEKDKNQPLFKELPHYF